MYLSPTNYLINPFCPLVKRKLSIKRPVKIKEMHRRKKKSEKETSLLILSNHFSSCKFVNSKTIKDILVLILIIFYFILFYF